MLLLERRHGTTRLVPSPSVVFHVPHRQVILSLSPHFGLVFPPPFCHAKEFGSRLTSGTSATRAARQLVRHHVLLLFLLVQQASL